MEVGRRGRKPRLRIEDEYWDLIRSGVGTVEACKLVGIGRRPVIGRGPNAAVCRRTRQRARRVTPAG